MKKVIKRILDLLIILLILLVIYLGVQIYNDYFKVKQEEQANFVEAVEELGSPVDYCQNNTIKRTENVPVINLDDYENNQSIGYMVSPDVNLMTSVVKGDTADGLWAAMNLGVSIDPLGTTPGQIGNTVIAGHREFAFKSLENIEEGTPIIINVDGNIYPYIVNHSEIIEDTDVDKVFFDDGKENLVLYTCYPFTFNSEVTGRYVTYLEPVDEVEVDCNALGEIIN